MAPDFAAQLEAALVALRQQPGEPRTQVCAMSVSDTTASLASRTPTSNT